MKNIVKMMERASKSKWALRKLNFIFSYGIPFNRPHGFKIKSIEENAITSIARYQRRNFNHIHGIHACAIATIAEFSAGSVLMMKFVPNQYRLIMSKLEVKYHYQAKQDLFARAEITPEQVSSVNVLFNDQDKVKLFVGARHCEIVG